MSMGLTTATRVLAGFTLLLVVIAGGQIVLFFWQLRLMREGVGDTKTAAGAATAAAAAATAQAGELRRSADATERALTHLERAYVFPSIVDVHTNDIRAPLVFKIRMRTMGRSPAIIKEVLIKFHGSCPLPDVPDISGADSQFFDWAIDEMVLTDDFLSPHAGPQYIFGFVRYLDIFQHEHRSWIGAHLDTGNGTTTRAGGDNYNSWD